MTIGLFLTYQCNYQCKHCMVDSTLKPNRASDEVIEKYIDLIKRNRPDSIAIVGGEPLLYADTVEYIINSLKGVVDNVLVYSNGTFLLNEDLRNRVKSWGIQVRISKTQFHKEFWTSEIESLIDDSPYIKVESYTYEWVNPRGRALENNLYDNHECDCSLFSESYQGHYYSNRYLVMPDGSVNIWCPCMSPEIANIFQDDEINMELLIKRESLLRSYIKSVNMYYNSMLFMCNEVCNRFKVTKDGVFRDGELM